MSWLREFCSPISVSSEMYCINAVEYTLIVQTSNHDGFNPHTHSVSLSHISSLCLENETLCFHLFFYTSSSFSMIILMYGDDDGGGSKRNGLLVVMLLTIVFYVRSWSNIALSWYMALFHSGIQSQLKSCLIWWVSGLKPKKGWDSEIECVRKESDFRY